MPKQKKERITCEWASGAAVGIGETILMPFDLLKVKKQTNATAFKNRSIFEIAREESIKNYFKGAPITALRNMVAMGNFFTMSAIVREYYYNTSDQWNMTFQQYLFISSCSAMVSISSSSPFDVVKTRMQNKDFGKTTTTFQVVKQIVKNEGPRAFYKSLLTKYVTIGPKIVFTYAVSLYFTSKLQK